MEIALPTMLPLLLLLFVSSTTAVPSAIAPAGAGEYASHVVLPSPSAAPSLALSPGADCGIYIVFVSRDDYVDSVDYDVRLLASVFGSTEEAKKAVIYHYSGLGFAARLEPNQADQLSRREGVATFKDKTYHVEKDGSLPRFFEENI